MPVEGGEEGKGEGREGGREGVEIWGRGEKRGGVKGRLRYVGGEERNGEGEGEGEGQKEVEEEGKGRVIRGEW